MEPILVADDDADYAVLLQVAFTEAGIFNPVEVVSDGLQVIDYLKGEGAYADRSVHPLPGFILLDLRLPVRHGFEVLRWIRRQPHLDGVFVAVFSGSGFETEARVAQELGANRFLVKPHEFGELVVTLRQLRDDWLESHRALESSAKH